LKKFLIGMLLAGATLASVVSSAEAQRYLDDYRGRDINDVKNSLRRQGFRDAGHVTKRRGTYALMFDGRNCIALHGGRGVIDEINMSDPRDCGERRRPRESHEDRRSGPPTPRY
jgi:hypothetical protein